VRWYPGKTPSGICSIRIPPNRVICLDARLPYAAFERRFQSTGKRIQNRVGSRSLAGLGLSPPPPDQYEFARGNPPGTNDLSLGVIENQIPIADLIIQQTLSILADRQSIHADALELPAFLHRRNAISYCVSRKGAR